MIRIRSTSPTPPTESDPDAEPAPDRARTLLGTDAPAAGRTGAPPPVAEERVQSSGSLATGIRAFDERTGGLAAGGVHLLVGPPGPAKLVLGLHLLRAGLEAGEQVALITGSDADSMLDVAEAWGVDLRDAFAEGRLSIVGFREDFELRAVRTTEPAAIFTELDRLVPAGVDRLLVDPAGTFLSSRTPSQLGREFLRWASGRTGSVFGTLPVEGGQRLPSHAEWLLHESTGLVVVAPRDRGFYTLELVPSRPDPGQDLRLVTVELAPGVGLAAPRGLPTRRAAEGGGPSTDPRRLLLLSMGEARDAALETWARESWSTTLVTDPIEAVTTVQGDNGFGAVLIQAPRTGLRAAARAIQALRPLTDAALVFTTDDAIRSGDRVRMLESGADDCLSGGVDFAELAARLRRAIEAGRGRSTPEPPQPWHTELDGGLVSRKGMAREIRARGDTARTAVFALLEFPAGCGITELQRQTLRLVMRSENGDLLVCDDDGCLVLLQGSRAAGASIYLTRATDRLPEGEAAFPDPAIHVHPSDRARIEALLDPEVDETNHDAGEAPLEETGAPDAAS